jgi:hypothetical protein
MKGRAEISSPAFHRAPGMGAASFLGLAVHDHDGLLHQRAQRLAAVPDREDLGLGHDQRATRTHDAPARDQPLAVCRRHQVHLVLDRQHRGAGRHQRHRRIARAGVGDHADHAAMDEAMLLLDALPVRQVDLGRSGLDHRHRGLDQVHRVLPVEARAHAVGEMRIGLVGHGEGLLSSGLAAALAFFSSLSQPARGCGKPAGRG